MGKIYAVKKGVVPGIYKTWPECQSNINGFPGAVYKSFHTEEEALEFLNGGTVAKTVEASPVSIKGPSEVIAYVDGSYNSDNNKYAFGMVILVNDQILKFADEGRDSTATSMRNVAGEILGAEKAMLFAINNGYKSLTICYDYEGIEKWCNEEWEAKNKFTKEYKERYNKYSKKISISFEKVAAHTGDKYNEMADSLAKSPIF